MTHLNIPRTSNRFYTTWKFMRDPFTSYRRWKKEFGDTFVIRALNGDVVATCNTENVRRVFTASADSVGQFAVETLKPLLGSSSLFLIEGQAHRRERSLLSPSFHGERIASKAESIRGVALQAGRRWQPGQTYRTMDSALDVSLEVIIRIVFGIQNTARIEEVKSDIKSFVEAFHPTLGFTRLLQRPLFGLSPWNKFVSAREKFHKTLEQEIAIQREQPLDESNTLSRLMHSHYEDGRAVDDTVIRDQLVTMLLAGHETTQIAMAWAMSWIHRFPEYLNRLRNELDNDDSIESIMGSALLNGICNESLRLNAIITDIVRTLRKPMDWVDYRLPAGTNIAVSICLVHEDPEIFPDPMKFDPDRWNDRQYKPHEFMPFGGGVRRCIGAPLAMMEMKIVVATWIKNFQFALPENIPDVEEVYRRNITMAPKSGIPLVFVGPR